MNTLYTDAKQVRHIDIALGYDNRTHFMRLRLKWKTISQTIHQMPRNRGAQTNAQHLMNVNDAKNALRLMLDGKYAKHCR